MFGYAATIFVSAFLLFQVQPMAARFVLPWFGGTSLVWTTCMLFFQLVLVLGYAWSHWIHSSLSPKRQWIVHTVVVVAAILTLPIRPGEFWKPVDGHMATWRLLLLLAASVGLPYFVVSTTGPLIQAWQSVTHPGKSPFRLFALSNFASLAALISYPLLYERFLTLDSQSWTWSCGFVLFGVLVSMAGYRFAKHCEALPESEWRAKAPVADRSDRVGLTRPVLWVLLPMLASVVLLSTTNMMTQEVGAVPFLWIIPLALYLISFIICFDHPFWYFRPLFLPLMSASVGFAAIVMNLGVDAPILVQIIGYSAVSFGVSMCCHGELAKLKPAPAHLTWFYLMIAIGGAMGGVFVALAAPEIFINYYEFPLSIIAAVMLVLFACGWQIFGSIDQTIRMVGEGKIPASLVGRQWPRMAMYSFNLMLGMIGAGLAVVATWKLVDKDQEEDVLLQTRNEYGTLTVQDREYTRQLTNGRIKHGLQFKEPRWSRLATSYYGATSGQGVAVEHLRSSIPDLGAGEGMSFGIIGLGVGTACAWCEKGDSICFYEINPRVVDIATDYFTYLEESPEVPVIRLGDARIQLEMEMKDESFRLYDILVVDAFSSDSIPVHLLTRESMQIYLDRITERGVVCIHTSNRFLQLANVVHVLAEDLGAKAVYVNDDTDDSTVDSSSWVLVSRNERFIDETRFLGHADDWPEPERVAFWTDDYSSIIPLIKWQTNDTWIEDIKDTFGFGSEE